MSTKPSYLTGSIGILPNILNTLYIILATLLIVLPLGVGAAVYLTEYARNKCLAAAIEYAAETLSGIPSIIFGLVGMPAFANTFGSCLLAGALTLAVMNLPTVMRTAQENLKTAPASLREGAFGLGAGRWRVIRTVVLPGCVDGIVTGCGKSTFLKTLNRMNDLIPGVKIMNGEMTVGMGGSFNLCDVRDLAHGCVAAADKGRVGECYILGNKEVALKEVCHMLHDASGYPAEAPPWSRLSFTHSSKGLRQISRMACTVDQVVSISQRPVS